MITNEHIEAWLLRYAENELNAEEISEVEAYLQIHPEWVEVLSDYDPDFRLPGADGIRCPVKDKLLREPQPKVRPAVWWKYSAVAAVFLLLTVAAAVLFRRFPQKPVQECVAERQPQLLPAASEDTTVVMAVEKSVDARCCILSAACASVPAAAGTADFAHGNSGAEAAAPPAEGDVVLLACQETSDEGASSDPEVEYIVQERPAPGDAAQVIYTIYTDQLLEVESAAESRPQSQPNLRQYVTGKVSDFVLKKIKENY